MLRQNILMYNLNRLPTFSLSGKNHEKINEIDGSLEKAAEEAVACHGMYTNVKIPQNVITFSQTME